MFEIKNQKTQMIAWKLFYKKNIWVFSASAFEDHCNKCSKLEKLQGLRMLNRFKNSKFNEFWLIRKHLKNF